MAGCVGLALLTPCRAATGPRPWATPEEADTLAADMRSFFDGAEMRFPGMPGNLAMEERVDALFERSGFEHGEIQFRAPCFVPGKTDLTLPDGRTLQFLPMHPSLLRPGNFSEKDFEADIVYIPPQQETLAIPLKAAEGINLRDKVILQEFGASWQDFMPFRPRGFIFIEAETCLRGMTGGKLGTLEARVPRFFISREDGEALKAAITDSEAPPRVRIRAVPSRWENRLLRDLWLFIPGSDPALERDVVLLHAPLDANCVVPELARGGTAGANLFMLTRLLEGFHTNPPPRSVMLAAVNARTQFYRGDRLLAWNLLAPLHRIEEIRDVMAEDIRYQELVADYYDRLRLDGTQDDKDTQFLLDLRTLTDKSLGRYITIKKPLVTRAKKDVNQFRSRQIALARRPLPEDPDARTAEELRRREQHEELESLRRQHVDILTLFNRVGVQTALPDLSAESVDILRDYVREIVATNRRWAELNRKDLDISMRNGEARRLLAGRRIALVLSLECDWESAAIGLCSGAPWGDDGAWATRFGKNTSRIAAALPPVAGGERPNLLANTMTRLGGIEEGYYFPADSGEGACKPYHDIEATPAFALRNVFASFSRTFTPDDTLENIGIENAAHIMHFFPRLLDGILSDPEITSPSELPPFAMLRSNKTVVWSGRVSTYRFDEFAADVLPTLPIPNCGVILQNLTSGMGVTAQGEVTVAIELTDERAQAFVYAHPWEKDMKAILCDAFGFDDDFIDVLHTVDAGDVQSRVKSEITDDTDPRKTLAVFRCREFPVFDRIDPTLVSAFPIVTKDFFILSASRNTAPRKYGFFGGDCLLSSKRYSFYSRGGPFTAYAEPSEPIKIVTKKKLCAINAAPDTPEGDGFLSHTEMRYGFLNAATHDLAALNAHRIGQLKGVSDELAHDFLRRGIEETAAMDTALQNHSYVSYLRHLYLALGSQMKAYRQATTITTDMLKAVVFYMALMLPFCFFLMKLLFKTVKIEAQMGLFAMMFVLTFIVFRTIHPAFRISQSPEAMFVAFIMGGLSLFVINVLHGRFEGEMQLIFQTYTGMDTAEVAYSTAGQQAMLIGVQNMKRRRVRTALTTCTIVLVTFTMLAFSSISKTMSPTVIPKEGAPSYTGILYHWPGQLMDSPTARVLKTLFDEKADIVTRNWWLSPRRSVGTKTLRSPMHLGCPTHDTSARLDAILALEMAEDGFLDRIPILDGGSYFSSNRADEVIITSGIAAPLGITPENLHDTVTKVRLLGRELRVVGILDDERFRLIHDIDDRPLLPVQVAQHLRGQEETSAMTDGEEQEGKAGIEYVDPSMMILMPIHTASSIPSSGSRIYSLSLRFADDEPLWPQVETLLTATDAKFYVGSKVPFRAGTGENARLLDAGVYYMGSGYKTSIGGLTVLIIPLLIASTIILNTMLGSVYERKAEIAVYNAVGLNPNHIFMFFLAEAFVYSVIGSVGGYLIGQVTALFLNRFDLISDINLNFSSLNVVYVILFTVSVVMLSTLYPAHVATRTAIPSGKRKWSIPPHDGRQMKVAFPFIYQEPLLPGIMRYLEEYFARFTEASLGDLLTVLEDRSMGRDESGRPVLSLRYHVALAPFDLGVTQTVTFRAGYDEEVSSYRVLMSIVRASGQDTNWVWTNRPFLERLRQHLMRWRNLDAAEHARFVERGRQAFGMREQDTEDNGTRHS